MGNIYVADSENHVIDLIPAYEYYAGTISHFAGLSGTPGSADGVGSAARFNQPTGLAVDSAGNVIVADTFNHTIRKITPSGVVSTLAGWVDRLGNTDGTGPSAQFYQPRGLALAPDGSFIVADTGNDLIRRVTQAGVVTTLGGLPAQAGVNTYAALGSNARFSYPLGVAVTSSGLIHVSNVLGNVISLGTVGPSLTFQANGATVPTVGGAVNFGSVAAGASQPIVIGVFDTGVTTFSNLAVSIDGPQAGDFAASGVIPRVTPQGLLFFTVTFTPSATGLRFATLHFTSAGGGINDVDFTLVGFGAGSSLPQIDYVTIFSSNLNPRLATNENGITIKFHLTQSASSVYVYSPRVPGPPPLYIPATPEGGNYYEVSFSVQPEQIPGGLIAFRIDVFDGSGNVVSQASQTTDGSSVLFDYYPPYVPPPPAEQIFIPLGGEYATLPDFRGTVTPSDPSEYSRSCRSPRRGSKWRMAITACS
jgi:hypothetical protein